VWNMRLFLTLTSRDNALQNLENSDFVHLILLPRLFTVHQKNTTQPDSFVEKGSDPHQKYKYKISS